MSGTREATHAGSWYTSSSSKLADELSRNLDKVTPLPDLGYQPPITNSKAIIAPHAGYSYSGPTAAWAYASIPTDKIKRVFLLGPSHHAYLPGVALSSFAKYATPLGDLPLCLDTIETLNKTGLFSRMSSDVDEDEHSLEMHLPYIRHVFKGDDLRLVPILVGQASAETGSKLAQVLEPYFKDPETYSIISSDFCHWGTRFSCTPYYPNPPPTPNPVPPVPKHVQPAAFEPPELVKKFSNTVAKKDTPIWKSIEYMDHEGMNLLREPGGFGAVAKWEAYLARTKKNTICGRNPITVLLQLLTHIAQRDGKEEYEFAFVRYEQSSKCESGSDSSVSYVSGVLRPKV